MAIYGNGVSRRLVGRVEVVLNGELLLNKSGAIARGIGEESGKLAVRRKAVMDCFGTAGFTEEIIPAGLDVVLTVTDNISLTALAAVKGNGTLIFRRATSLAPNASEEFPKTLTLDKVTCMVSPEINAGEGEIPVVFEACGGNGWIES